VPNGFEVKGKAKGSRAKKGIWENKTEFDFSFLSIDN